MHLAGQISFWLPYLGIEIILLVLLFFWLFKKDFFDRFLKISSLAVAGLVILSWASQIILTYFSLKSSDLGPYLISGKNSFFANQAISISKEFLMVFVLALFFYFLVYFVYKRQKRPIFNENSATIFFISILALSSIRLLNFIPGLISAFILAILWQIVLKISRKEKSENRVDIIPCLLISAAIIEILSLFPFYFQFLIWARLI